MTPSVTLHTVKPCDLPAFKRRLREELSQAARELFPDFADTALTEGDVDGALGAPGAEALQIWCDGEQVGGAVVTGEGTHMLLDFIYIDAGRRARQLGLAAWNALEARYPQATHWELCTPYRARRNIHFYVNKCGFCVTEYYNSRHPDPHWPQDELGDSSDDDGGMFKLEKDIAR